jgi:hypothetical protein
MLTFIAYFAIAAFVGIAVLGHIFVLQAMFTSADHADGQREPRTQKSFLPDLPV